MRNLRRAIIAMLLLMAPAVALAAKGEIVLYKSGCDYFIVETNMGFALLEWYGGYDPSEGEIVAGDFESYGFKDIYNLSADRETRVWIEDYWLSRDRVIEEYLEKCD